MNRQLLIAAVAGAVCAASALASTVTVVGPAGGHIIYDGQDVGPVPLRLTQVPPGRHLVRVVTAAGERSFDLVYPAGQSVDRTIDMRVELARSEAGPQTQQLVQPVPPPPQDDGDYPYVYPSDQQLNQYYYDRRAGYYDYPYRYDYYPYGYYGYGYPYYDNYYGIYPYYPYFGYCSRHHRRDQCATPVPGTGPAPAPGGQAGVPPPAGALQVPPVLPFGGATPRTTPLGTPAFVGQPLSGSQPGGALPQSFVPRGTFPGGSSLGTPAFASRSAFSTPQSFGSRPSFSSNPTRSMASTGTPSGFRSSGNLRTPSRRR